MKLFFELMAPIFIPIFAGLAFVAVLYRIKRPREARIDKYNPLAPIFRWMNTAGSILLAANKADFRSLGGFGYRVKWENYQTVLKKSLWEYWGIQGHDTAAEEMRFLVTTGMRAQYKEEMERLSSLYAGYSEEQLIEAAQETNPKADEDSFLPKMLMAYRRYGEDAILGWDVGRCVYIVQTCYLLGGQYWQREDKSNPNSMTAERWKLYQALWKGKKPYKECPYVSTPFDLPLSKDIDTDKYGILPEYQKYYKRRNS